MKHVFGAQLCAILLTLALLTTALIACQKEPPIDSDETDSVTSESATETQKEEETVKETESESASVSESETESESVSEIESASESESDSDSTQSTNPDYKLFSQNGIEFFYPKNFTVSHQSSSMSLLMDSQAHASIAPTIKVSIDKIAANKDGTPRYDAISLITKVEDFAATHPDAENIVLNIGEKRTTLTYEETAPSSEKISYFTYIQIVTEPTENGELTYASIQVREYSADREVASALFVD